MARDADLFAKGAAKVWTIPPGADFLGALARGLAGAVGLHEDSGALSGAIIYVPNRRSARALTLELFRASGGQALLAPDIRALGDLESGEAAPTVEEALAGLPPQLPPGERLGELARLVHAYYLSAYGTSLPPASALQVARDLVRLLDQAALSEHVDWRGLADLVEPADLAGHWQSSVRFLDIIVSAWPAYLAERGVMEPFQRRLAAAEALVRHWESHPPEPPVVIAGSTGATPSGRLIMKAAMQLPRGLIVLPGLDTDADEKAWEAISAAPGHPQYALIRTLRALDVAPASVSHWPGIDEAPPSTARRRLIQEALAPASETADWRDTLTALAEASGQTVPAFAHSALAGLSHIELAHEGAEAQAAAALLRETLETPGKTAALVTPDAGLARRVSALLKRWDIHVQPSSGVPLARTPAGSLIGLIARWMLDPSAPIALTAVIRHALVPHAPGTDELERYHLRGPRAWRSLAQLEDHIRHRHEHDARAPGTREDAALAADRVAHLTACAGRAKADVSDVSALTGRDFVERLYALAGEMTDAPALWSGEHGRAASKLLEHIALMTAPLGPLAPAAIADLIEAESARTPVIEAAIDHPRLSIWGPLEARLQTAGRIVLAGLNEDLWPERPPADVFLPRRFRSALGFNDPEERMGLSAHDFAQLASAREVFLLSARRRNDAPAVASRWVWRLQTLARGALLDEAAEALRPDLPVAQWVERIEREGIDALPQSFSAEPKPAARPAGWPLRLPVTRIDTLQRDPYALWAENVLELSPEMPLDAPVDVRVRGTAIHKAIEDFERARGQPGAEDLVAFLRDALRRAGEAEASWIARAPVWQKSAEWLHSWFGLRSLAKGASALRLEHRGETVFNFASGAFRLYAVADRIETAPDGSIIIVDFKSGNPPSAKEILSGLSQQMPLQALIAAEGGFDGGQHERVSGLEYVAFKARPDAWRVEVKTNQDIAMLISEAKAGLEKLIESYRAPGSRFLSAPRVQFIKYDSDYMRLARRAEWAVDVTDHTGGGDA